MTERAERLRKILTDIESWNPFCHGTTTVFQRSIEKNGLQARECTEDDICRPSVYEGKLESHPDKVYLGLVRGAQGRCMESARRAAEKFNGDAILFGVELEEGDEKKLTHDEDAEFMLEKRAFDEDYPYAESQCRHSMWIAGEKLFPKTGAAETVPIPAVNQMMKDVEKEGAYTDEEADYVCGGLPSWVYSLMSMKTLAVEKEVPPEKIKGPVPRDEMFGLYSEEAMKKLREEPRLGKRTSEK